MPLMFMEVPTLYWLVTFHSALKIEFTVKYNIALMECVQEQARYRSSPKGPRANTETYHIPYTKLRIRPSGTIYVSLNSSTSWGERVDS